MIVPLGRQAGPDMITKTAVGYLLSLVLTMTGCARAGHGRVSGSPATLVPVAATASLTPAAQGPLVPFIGTLVSRSGTTLTVRDGNGGGGLITLVVQPDTIIDGATSGPTYAHLQDHDLQRLKAGQTLSGPARRQPDGSLVTTAISIGSFVPRGAEVVATGAGYIDVHLQRGRLSDTFAPETTRLMLAPQSSIRVLGPGGRKTPADLSQVKASEVILFDGAQADDGSLVVFDISLGPGDPSPTPAPASGTDRPAPAAAFFGSTPQPEASISIARFTDAGWGNTTIDESGAVVLASPQIGLPTILRLGTPPDQLLHRYGFYELTVSAPVPITDYRVAWTEETPPGSKVEMFTGATDYRSGPGMSESSILRGDTSAEVTLAQPAEHAFVTFQLFSGIGADPSDPGASPRVTSVTISSPDTDSLSAVPLRDPLNGVNINSLSIAGSGPPGGGPIPPAGSLVQAPAFVPFSPSLRPQDRPPVWSTNPTLDAVSGESYQGRIVFELYRNAGDDQTLFTPGTMTQPQFRQQALTALQSQTSPARTPAVWPSTPITGGSAPDSGPYLGRVVVELWDSTTNVAVTAVDANGQDLVQRAIQDLTAARHS